MLYSLMRNTIKKKKRPVVSYGRPQYLDVFIYTYGLSTHDFLDLEKRHHHAVDTNVVILFCSF